MAIFKFQILTAIALFAVAGGWCAVQAARIFSGTRVPLLLAIAICAGTAISAFYETGLTPIFAVSLLLGWTLFTLAAVDAAVFRLPDLLTLPLAVAGICITVYPLHQPILDHLVGAALGLAVFAAVAWAYKALRGREGLGFGDAKLACAAGAWLGWTALPSMILIACVFGLLLVGVKAILKGRAALTERIPFGVALALAIWVVWLLGPLEIAAA
jgi:leader peptidase (prepilin peptidase) / N-methyltransferase